MTESFPGPALQTDDGNQDTADLHAREDLLLDHYSRVPGQQGMRIPIDRAMQLIAAAWVTCCAGGSTGADAGRGYKARRDTAAHQWLCPYRL